MVGKDIEIATHNGALNGRSLGIDRDGALLVDTVNGVQAVRSGYVSLRIRSGLQSD